MATTELGAPGAAGDCGMRGVSRRRPRSEVQPEKNGESRQLELPNHHIGNEKCMLENPGSRHDGTGMGRIKLGSNNANLAKEA